MSRRETAPIVYDIRTVEDFLKVPAKRRRACAKEFATWLDLHDHFITLITPPEHPGCVSFDGVFRWRDDGRRKVNVEIRVKEPA